MACLWYTLSMNINEPCYLCQKTVGNERETYDGHLFHKKCWTKLRRLAKDKGLIE